MAYSATDLVIGYQPIANTDTALNHPLGTIIRATDPTYGTGEFIYLKGVASTVIGSLVTYNETDGTTALAPSTANLGQPVAVAMAANILATTYGWYQISGAAVIKKTAVKVNPNVAIFLSGTAGRIFPTATTGKQILGARATPAATIASATSTVIVTINRPHCQGQII